VLKIGNSFFWRAKFKVIHPHNDVEAKKIWTFAESMGQTPGCCVVVEQTLISETQVGLRFNQAWVQGENFFELLGRTKKITVFESRLAGAKRGFDILLRRLAVRPSGDQQRNSKQTEREGREVTIPSLVEPHGSKTENESKRKAK